MAVTGGDWSFAGLAGADLRGCDLSTLDPRTTELVGARIDMAQAVVLVTALGLAVSPDAPE